MTWPFGTDDGGSSEPPHTPSHNIKIGPDARHIDVAILWGLGMKNRAQHLARELRPKRVVVGSNSTLNDTEIRRVRGRLQKDE